MEIYGNTKKYMEEQGSTRKYMKTWHNHIIHNNTIMYIDILICI